MKEKFVSVPTYDFLGRTMTMRYVRYFKKHWWNKWARDTKDYYLKKAEGGFIKEKDV